MSNNSVTVLVFKFNLAAIFGIILVSIITLVFLIFILMSGGNYIWFAFPVVLFIIYIRYAKNAPFKARIVDDNRLTLSSTGIQYGETEYPLHELETVAIYLYAFENFEYRDGFVADGQEQHVYVRAHGDQNKISFRASGEVFDFDFYLDDFAQFSAVRKVLNDWATSGINVVLKQAFDDDFIVQEMSYYNTPSGL